MSDAPRTALGVDIGGTHTKIGLISSSGRVLEWIDFPTGGHTTPASFTGDLVRGIARILQSDSARQAPPAGIGVSVAGLLDDQREQITFAPNIAFLDRFPLRKLLFETFTLPVFLEVDGNAAALAEYHFGAGRNTSRFLCLVLGTGVGGGMIADGSLLRFSYQGIGDPGHVILMPDGPACSAGCRGCAEALLAASAVEQRAETAAKARRDSTLAVILEQKGKLQVPDLVEAAREGDAVAMAVWAETGQWLGRAMASLAAIFMPDCIAIGGGLAEAGACLLEPAERAFRSSTGRFYQERVTVRPAQLGWRAAAIGAAALVLIPERPAAGSLSPA